MPEVPDSLLIGSAAAATLGGLLQTAADRPARVDTTPFPPTSALHAELATAVREGGERSTVFFDCGRKLCHGPLELDDADLSPAVDAVLTAVRAGVAQAPTRAAEVGTAGCVDLLTAARSAAPLAAPGR